MIRGDKTAKLACLILGAALFLYLASAPTAAKGVKQPIQYSHKKHVQDLELDCLECHEYAKSMARATIPNLELCADCHSELITESPEEKKLIDYLNRGEKIPWVKVYRVNPHVYFSHKRHTVLAQIECETCHGKIEDQVESISHQLVPVTMNNCVRCHEDNKVDNDCTRCHR